MKPTIGRTIMYNLGESDKKHLEALYKANQYGNIPDVAPAVIVAVWSDTCVNIKVHIDGPTPDLWKTSVQQGDDESQWNWPVIHK